MMLSTTFLLLTIALTQVYTAPQFINFDDGKLGVNFGGYHAGVGLGGLLGGGAGGGLFAEAGTPHGQAARAGLGGAVNSKGGAAGGLYAGATAGGNVKASAGLAGGATPEKTAGVGYAAAQAGNHQASSGLGGETSIEGASGFSFSGSKSFGISNGVVKEFEVDAQPVETIKVKPVEKTVHKEFNTETSNEVNAVPLTPVSNTDVEARSNFQANVNIKTQAQPSLVVKEVVYQPPPIVEKRIYHPPPIVEKHVYVEQPQIVEKTLVRTRYKPRRQHFRKTAYIGGYIGGGDISSQPAPVVYKTVQPIIEKRIDIDTESAGFAGINANAGAAAETNFNGGHAGEVAYTKQVTFQRNPSFFADIFNIPISTLKAVGNFLGNAAGNTHVSVQKTATLQAGAGVGAGFY